jgi:hypothetical protein
MGIEFNAKVKNGEIAIPKEFIKRLGRCKRVHVVIDRDKSRRKKGKVDILERLMAHPVLIEGFRPLKREDIYDRTRK